MSRHPDPVLAVRFALQAVNGTLMSEIVNRPGPLRLKAITSSLAAPHPRIRPEGKRFFCCHPALVAGPTAQLAPVGGVEPWMPAFAGMTSWGAKFPDWMVGDN